MQILFAVVLVCLTTLSAQAEKCSPPLGKNAGLTNVALGKSYKLKPENPNYPSCSDEKDLKQLTDGDCAPGKDLLWGHKECVGWVQDPQDSNVQPVVITIDLGEDTSIAGVAVSTGAGRSGVPLPPVLLIAVSQDEKGEQFDVVGELMYLAAKHGAPPLEGGRYVFATKDLRCHGRRVRLVIPPGRYFFSDEIEVYRGSDALLKETCEGQRLNDIETYLSANQVPMAIRNWVAWDIFRARDELKLKKSSVPVTVQQDVAADLDELEEDNSRLVAPPGDHYRSVFPLTGAHDRLFRALGKLRNAEDRPPLQLWKSNRWQRLSLWDLPPAGQTAQQVTPLQIRMIQGERRADAVNILNNTDQPVSARVWLDMKDLPGGATPEYVSLRQAEYVALTSGRWDADALPEAGRQGDRWKVDLPAGVSRQLWLAFHPGADVEPKPYQGKVIVEANDGKRRRLQIPLELTVEPLKYPEKHTLAFGMWDYAYPGPGVWGLRPGNRLAAIDHMRSYGYNVPWSHLFPWVDENNFDKDDNLVKTPDFDEWVRRFDNWVCMWPDASYYAVYAQVNNKWYAGVDIVNDSGKFKQRVAAVMQFWAKHVRELGIDPRRILILTVDEPDAEPNAENKREWSLRWAEAIKEAVPEFTLFITAVDPEPQKENPDPQKQKQKMKRYEAHDVLCPYIGSYYPYPPDGQGVRKFYQELRDKGKQLWLYMTDGGPASLSVSAHRSLQWKLWESKGTGTHFWSYADVGGSPGGSWNQFAAVGEIFSKVYIDGTSVTDGKHWLAIVEGIQDYEYLKMLHDRIAKPEATGHKSQDLDSARKLLDTLPAKAIKAAEKGDIEAYDRARLCVLDALLALRDESKVPRCPMLGGP